ncbi:SEC61-beta family protein [Candidatus Woesearchaeota archaeon]|nr:SEC61-beta family protein [Candidatus Woesearchaeota archaeon]
MAQDLASYIRQQLKAGYNVNSIRAALLKYGYQQPAIDAAIRQAYAQPQAAKPAVHISPTTIIALTAVFIVVVLGGILAFNFMKGEPAELLGLETTITTTEAMQGDDLEFDVELLDLGAAGRQDVSLRYLIMDANENVVQHKEETAAIETGVPTKAKIRIPSSLAPANYQLKVLARYNGKLATAVETFSVAEAPTPPPTLPEEEEEIPREEEFVVPTEEEREGDLICEDGDPCTTDFLALNECVSRPIIPCCGNGKCETGETYTTCSDDCPKPPPPPPPAPITPTMTTWEKLSNIEQTAFTNPSKAGQQCADITDRVFRDDCYGRVAQASTDEQYCDDIMDQRAEDNCIRSIAKELNDAGMCAKIIKDTIRDNCYMVFATAGRFELCDKLTQPFLKQNCYQLEKLYELQQLGPRG